MGAYHALRIAIVRARKRKLWLHCRITIVVGAISRSDAVDHVDSFPLIRLYAHDNVATCS